MFNSDGDYFPKPKTWQQRILRAAAYAGFAQGHPIYRRRALETQTSAYTQALLDSLGKPKLVGLDVRRWRGLIGQAIHIRVRDNFQVLAVRLMFRKDVSGDDLLEAGYAFPSKLDPQIWTYLTQTEFQPSTGFCMDVIATDLTGNVSVDTVEFNPVE